jgi:hypothetical protein
VFQETKLQGKEGRVGDEELKTALHGGYKVCESGSGEEGGGKKYNGRALSKGRRAFIGCVIDNCCVLET